MFALNNFEEAVLMKLSKGFSSEEKTVRKYNNGIYTDGLAKIPESFPHNLPNLYRRICADFNIPIQFVQDNRSIFSAIPEILLVGEEIVFVETGEFFNQKGEAVYQVTQRTVRYNGPDMMRDTRFIKEQGASVGESLLLCKEAVYGILFLQKCNGYSLSELYVCQHGKRIAPPIS